LAAMGSRGFRRATRVAMYVAALCLLVVLVIAVVRLLAAAPSEAIKQELAVAQLVAGALSAISAVSGALLARTEARTRDRRVSELLTPQLLDDEQLVNRVTEMRDLVARIDDSRAVGCHGPRGAGKSFLLEHLTDVINGHRAQPVGQPRPKRVVAAIYFDLADAIGFEEAQAQICGAVLGDPTGTWSDFALSVDRTFGHRRVVLILDNVNSEGIWRQLGQAAHRYCAVRPQDRVVFGSIDQVALSNLKIAQVQVLGLDLDATEELVATRGVSLSREKLITLHHDSQGLPFYVPFFTAQGADEPSAHLPAVSDQRIIPDLASDTRQLVAYAALLALGTRRIRLADLRASGVANLEKQLDTAVRRLLISPVPDGRNRRYKIHDIARDAALRELSPEVEDAAVTLFDHAHGQGNLEHAALFAMFVDPDRLDAARLDDLLNEVIGSAVRSKNYALIDSLHARAGENAKMVRFLAREQPRADLFSFARASELAGLGRYEEAEEELLTSSAVRTRWQHSTTASDLRTNLRFLQADLAHLLNRYDESALMFDELAQWAAANDRQGLEARCVWGYGHVLRHQGRDFELALRLLDRAAFLAGEAGEVFTKAYAVCNASGIKLIRGCVPEDHEQRLAAVEFEVASDSSRNAYLLEVWKTQAQLAWWRGDRQRASDIVDAAIERALELNDRLLYNLYFERAEFQRLMGASGPAIEHYRAVLEFGSGNRDRNLISQALLGLVLAEMTGGRWVYHETRDNARAALLRARQIASDADIQLTVQIAQQVTAMLDTQAPTPDRVRLFLL
jgi:tetratricopeptide (TPR) repeat protein